MAKPVLIVDLAFDECENYHRIFAKLVIGPHVFTSEKYEDFDPDTVTASFFNKKLNEYTQCAKEIGAELQVKKGVFEYLEELSKTEEAWKYDESGVG
jgi:hypothetical protein